MEAKDKIEKYILDLDLPFEEIDEKTWLIYESEDSEEKIVIYHEDPVVHFRLKIMELPEGNKENLYKTLLELNANSIMHGAFALEENSIVLIDTLQSENLDFNEFQASIDSLFMGAIDNYETLNKFQPIAMH